MFDAVHVENFQSIAKADVKFPLRESGGSLTTVVGASNTGKSALLRALHTLVYNTNSSASRVRAGEGSLKVKATLTDGTVVSVERGKSLSTYTLDDEVYTKAGTSTPEDVAERLKMGQSDLHIRFQFSAPYLLTETPTNVAAAFARITHAHTLREAVREGNRRSLRAKQEAETLHQQMLDFDQEIEEKNSALVEKREKVESLAARVEKASEMEATLDRVSATLTAVETASRAIAAVQSTLTVYEGLPDADKRLSEARTVANRMVTVRTLVASLEAARAAQTEVAVVPDLTERMAMARQVVEKLAQVRRLVVQTVPQSLHTDLAEKAAAVESLAAEVAELRSSMKICPTCGQEVAA